MADGDLQPPLDPTNMGQAIGSQTAPDLGQAPQQMPSLAPQPVQRPGGGRLPLLAQMLAETIKAPMQMQADPGQLATMRPVSRAGDFEGFIGQFLQAMGAGFANEGRGPGSFYRGFGAAQQAPQQYAMQQAQFGQQMQENQARIQGQQAQTQLTQAQLAGLPAEQQAKLAAMTAQPRWDPNTRDFLGTMTDAAFANYVKGQGAAKQNALSKQAQADLAAGKVAKYLPTPDGRYLALDAKGQPLHVVDGAVDPQMMQRYSSTQQLVPDGAGGYLVIPKTTTSGVATTPQQKLQAQVPALGANQTPQTQLQQKVPALGNAANSPAPSSPAASSPRQIMTNAVGMAFDPQSNSYVQETAAEAQAAGHQQFQKLTTKESEENRQLNNRLADVAQKITYYQQSMNQPIGKNDQVMLGALLGEDKWKAEAFGASIPIDWFNKQMDAAKENGLSGNAVRRLFAYYNARESMVGYQRVLSGGSKSNEKAMQLNLDALPNPILDPRVANEGLRQFTQNVMVAGQGLPRMKGITSAADILGARSQTPTTTPGQLEVPTDLLQRLGLR